MGRVPPYSLTQWCPNFLPGGHHLAILRDAGIKQAPMWPCKGKEPDWVQQKGRGHGLATVQSLQGEGFVAWPKPSPVGEREHGRAWFQKWGRGARTDLAEEGAASGPWSLGVWQWGILAASMTTTPPLLNCWICGDPCGPDEITSGLQAGSWAYLD